MIATPAAMHEKDTTFWQRRIVAPVISQLVQGATPGRLAWSISAGLVLGIFPILGSTTLVCLAAGALLRLNHPVMQLSCQLMTPLHLLLILPFIRCGEMLYRVPAITLSIPELLARFKASPTKFAGDFGWAAWHGISAWLLVAPILLLLLKTSITPLLRKLLVKVQSRKADLAPP
ncbi:MAG: hypothetical protein JWO82_1029 [Akkermansiaceae bacterium]|nr:hypothetical protein [Akkermansiaceae bacterium]